jgi:hypothetical protein
MSRQHIPITPYADPAKAQMEKELADLRRKVELDPMAQQLKAQEERIKQLTEGGGPQKGASMLETMLQMMDRRAAEAEAERKHQLAVAESERKAREAAEDRRAAREEAERKARQEADEKRWEREKEREREDRLEREKMQNSLLSTLVKISTEGATKQKDPLEAAERLIGVIGGVRDLNAPPARSETAEITEAVTAGTKEVIGAIGEAAGKWRGGAPASAGNPAPTDERLQLLDAINYLKNLARTGKVKPAAAFTAVYAWAQGRFGNEAAEKIAVEIAKCKDREGLDALIATLKEYSESSLVPAEHKPTLKEAHELLSQETHSAWLLEMGGVAGAGQ